MNNLLLDKEENYINCIKDIPVGSGKVGVVWNEEKMKWGFVTAVYGDTKIQETVLELEEIDQYIDILIKVKNRLTNYKLNKLKENNEKLIKSLDELSWAVGNDSEYIWNYYNRAIRILKEVKE